VKPLVSVVVPVLDEARALPGLLDHLAGLPGRWEVVVCDGGSRDGSAELARGHSLGPRVVSAPRGRAAQQNAGAAAATGEVLVFLHADSRLPEDAYSSLAGALRDPGCPGGNFAVRFDGGDRFSRGLTRWYAVQRRFGVYYGDSTLWLRRAEWDASGGFPPLAILEDLALVRKLERHGRTACLPGPALTSPRRWRALGWWRTGLAWTVIRWAWMAGVPAERLAALYRPVR
jgi:rSAM/selenodomain-associated transferase 2